MSEGQTRNNRLLIIALIVVVVLFLLCCCLAAAGLVVAGVLSWPEADVFGSRVEATERLGKSFQVSTPASLEVDVNVGDVFIQAGDGDQVHISAVKHAWGRNERQAEEYLDDFKVRFRQTTPDGQVKVEAETPPKPHGAGRTPRVDLDITVPRDARLTLTVNVGEVVVTGVRGSFDIDSNVGDVTLRDVRFEENSFIKSAVGTIDLHLPPDSAFSFNAESNVGDIRVDFLVRNEDSEKRVVGGKIRGEIGDSPIAHIDLRTNTGSIAIRRED